MINSYQSHMHVDIFENLTHMLLVLHWALSNYLWPLWDLFHAFKIKITNTPHILVPTSTLEVAQKHAFHPHKNTLIILTWLFILQKEYGLCERKRKSICAQKHRKRKKKDSPYLKIKDSHVERGESSIQKIPHTCTSWSDCVTCFPSGSSFLLCNIWGTSMRHLHPLPWAPLKSLIRNREERGNPMTWQWIMHIKRSKSHLRSKILFWFKNLSKNPSYLAEGVELTWSLKLALKLWCTSWRGSSAIKKS